MTAGASVETTDLGGVVRPSSRLHAALGLPTQHRAHTCGAARARAGARSLAGGARADPRGCMRSWRGCTRPVAYVTGRTDPATTAEGRAGSRPWRVPGSCAHLLCRGAPSGFSGPLRLGLPADGRPDRPGSHACLGGGPCRGSGVDRVRCLEPGFPRTRATCASPPASTTPAPPPCARAAFRRTRQRGPCSRTPGRAVSCADRCERKSGDDLFVWVSSSIRGWS